MQHHHRKVAAAITGLTPGHLSARGQSHQPLGELRVQLLLKSRQR